MIKTNNQKLQEPTGAKRVGAPHPDFFSKINKIVNFFARTRGGGFIFSTCDSATVTAEIINTVIQRAKEKKLEIKKVSLTPRDGEFFLDQVRAVVEKKPDGIIIAGLDKSIALTKDKIIEDINFSRDILLAFKLPFLFCVSSGNIAKFANRAQDLFLRRARGVVHFPAVPEELSAEIQEYIEKLGSFNLEPKELEDPESLNVQLRLLEDQLKEAEKKKYPPKRIANEIALDLIYLYSLLKSVRKADELFNKYKPYFNLRNHSKTLQNIGELYIATSRFDEALELLLKFQKIQEKTGDETGLGMAFFRIGSLYIKKVDFNKSIEYFLKAKELFEKAEMPLPLVKEIDEFINLTKSLKKMQREIASLE